MPKRAAPALMPFGEVLQQAKCRDQRGQRGKSWNVGVRPGGRRRGECVARILPLLLTEILLWLAGLASTLDRFLRGEVLFLDGHRALLIPGGPEGPPLRVGGDSTRPPGVLQPRNGRVISWALVRITL